MSFQLENQRKLSDAAFATSVPLPAAGSTVYTSSFDLIQSFSTSEKYAAQIDVPATTSSTGSITGFLQHAPDNATWSNIPELGSTLITVTSGSTPLTSDQFRLPPTTLEFIRAGFTVSSGAGAVQNFNGSLSLRF
jgi:hypothetical protein